MSDRLVIVTSPHSSTPIRRHLPSVLARVPSLAPGQPIEDAAVNDQERAALRTVLAHVERSWQDTLGVSPTDTDLRQLLSLIRVHILDVDPGGRDELHAKDLLRSAVLLDPTQADVAWALLVKASARFASERGGADRIALKQALLEAGIELAVSRSYSDDVSRLREYSAMAATALADFSEIRVGPARVKIARRSIEALKRVAEGGSLLVTGDPGAGKSGAISDLVVALRNDGKDLVCLMADRLEAQSAGALRNEIGLGHDIPDVLKNWPGTEPAFLIVDGLDSARSDAAAQMLRDLIKQTEGQAPRWRVIASIRKFDLRYNRELRALFSGAPPAEFLDTEFRSVRHVNIPVLDKDELEQIQEQSADLANLLQTASIPFRDMLRVPFNLRLAGDLLGEGVAPSELTPIRTQIGLLDRYWDVRVVRSDGQGDARETVLRRAAEAMVRSRTLRADRAAIGDAGTSRALAEVLSSHVLTEWQPGSGTTPER
jgi:hypothetical protein